MSQPQVVLHLPVQVEVQPWTSTASHPGNELLMFTWKTLEGDKKMSRTQLDANEGILPYPQAEEESSEYMFIGSWERDVSALSSTLQCIMKYRLSCVRRRRRKSRMPTCVLSCA